SMIASGSTTLRLDFDILIEQYGADTARFFMLSDSPPERDVEWTAAGVEGAWRFLQRVWRMLELVGPAAEIPASFSTEATALRKLTHKTIAGVTEDIEGFTFNKAVARLYEFANGITRLDGNEPDAAFARREAVETLVQLMNPMAPHFTEEMWAALGQSTPLVDTAWPAADPALLTDDTILLPVQVNGRKRAEISVPRDAEKASIEEIALAMPDVARHLGGQPPKKVIVVPGRIVNVVV
ncbi:MAG: class I tRNA ligase family protein, partial [Pseudomonadota bacterium]